MNYFCLSIIFCGSCLPAMQKSGHKRTRGPEPTRHEETEAVVKKHQLLLAATKDKDRKAAKILLADGGKPDYVLDVSEPKIACAWGTSWQLVRRKEILRHANLEFFSLFLRNGLDPDTRWRGDDDNKESLLESALKSEYCVNNPNHWRNGGSLYLYPLANVLLYHGAKIEKDPFVIINPNSELRRLMKHAHARRVYRMAKYLQRCFGTVKHPKAEHPLFLPNEIALMIAEHRYGRLSAADNELIKGYHEDDYKKKKN